MTPARLFFVRFRGDKESGGMDGKKERGGTANWMRHLAVDLAFCREKIAPYWCKCSAQKEISCKIFRSSPCAPIIQGPNGEKLARKSSQVYRHNVTHVLLCRLFHFFADCVHWRERERVRRLIPPMGASPRPKGVRDKQRRKEEGEGAKKEGRDQRNAHSPRAFLRSEQTEISTRSIFFVFNL